MPTYQYRCETCGLEFEEYQSFTDDSIPKCPDRATGACKSRGKGRVKKVFSAPGITFKGSGFYKNDSRSGGSSSSSSSESSSSDSSGDSDSKKSDTTSDAKKSDTKKADAKKSDSKKSDSKKSDSKKSKQSKTSAS